jgi:hypothetical protein
MSTVAGASGVSRWASRQTSEQVRAGERAGGHASKSGNGQVGEQRSAGRRIRPVAAASGR